jgi:hypothetical protein
VTTLLHFITRINYGQPALKKIKRERGTMTHSKTSILGTGITILGSTLLTMGGVALAESLSPNDASTSDRTNSNSMERTEDRKDATEYRRDNTGINERDRNGNKMVPQDQSEGARALDITRRIRADIVGTDSLSSNAKNIKVMTGADGRVTLRGPVRSAAERNTLSQIAQNIAGKDQVVNELEIVS